MEFTTTIMEPYSIINRKRFQADYHRRGFTLVELLVAASLSVMLLACIFSAALFYTKSGLAMVDYSDMERMGRRVIETFSQDARSASNVVFTDATTLQLTVDSQNITYSYEASELRRQVGGVNRLLTDDLDTFVFRPYDTNGDLLALNGDLSIVNEKTKMIQLYFQFVWQRPNGFKTQSRIETSRFMLRNRKIGSSI